MRSNATGRVKSSPPQTLATLASRSVVVSRQQRLARGACGHAGALVKMPTKSVLSFTEDFGTRICDTAWSCLEDVSIRDGHWRIGTGARSSQN